MSTEKSDQGGRVIDGAVGAEAGPAGVSVNQGMTYTVAEAIHHRRTFNPANGEALAHHTLIENRVTSGTPPKDFCVFTGMGTLEAKITIQEGQPPQAHREDYRFPLTGCVDLEDAWAKFDGFAARGAEVATADFRKRYAQYEERMRSQLLVPGSPGGLVGPGGRPLGG